MTARPQIAHTPPSAVPSAPVAEMPLGPPPPTLVLFGREGGKPRAAWFPAADVEAATAAAAIMRLRALPLADDAGRELAGQLARGRMLASGRALVPFAKRDLFDRVVALVGVDAGPSVPASDHTDISAAAGPLADPPGCASPPAPEAGGDDAPDIEEPVGAVAAAPVVANEATDKPHAPRPGAHLFVGQPRPADRAEIGLGSIVLAHEGPDDGWWEAEVIGANGRTFSLRWRDFDPAAFSTILRTADELALLPPGVP